MNTPYCSDTLPAGFFTAFAFGDRVELLCRSADWYNVPPIKRYLLNMAAREIRMEDARTETRVYAMHRFEHLRHLLQLALDYPWEVAWEAWMLWAAPDHQFGVVHLDQEPGRRGNLLIGDDPADLGEFAPDDPSPPMPAVMFAPSRSSEGSDA